MGYPLADDTLLGMLGVPTGNIEPGLITPGQSVGRAAMLAHAQPQSEPERNAATPGVPATKLLGPFLPNFIRSIPSEQLGVGVITYYGLEDARVSLSSIAQYGGEKYWVVVFDNTDDDSLGAVIRSEFPWAGYIRSPQNVGCARARNRLAEIFGVRGIQRFVIQDQDVEWCADVPALMGKVFDAYPDTGQVTLPLAIRQMQSDKPDAWDDSGLLKRQETPGMCCMYTLDAVAAVGGWESSMFMYRFDTLFSLLANQLGYRIRVAIGADNAVRHNHPHSGILRYPRWREEQARSLRIFREVLSARGCPVPSGL